VEECLQNFILLIFTSLFLFSCAKPDELVCQEAKEEAKYHLTKENCSKAFSALSNACGSDDSEYIALQASAYGCRANYSELDLFDLDIDNINSSSLLSSLASLSSSNETQADSTEFVALQSAIQTILTATSGNPSANTRKTEFGTDNGDDLNFQALFMITVQLGKYFAYYGNADNLGNKGSGSLGNTCIYSYTNADAIDWITSTAPDTGTCVNATGSEGSDDLEAPVTSTEVTTRLCEGIILFNNFMDILGNVDLTDSIYGDLSSVKTAVDALYTTAIAAENTAYSTATISTVKDIRLQSDCEALTTEQIEKYFAIFFESIYL
tara:strand:- start:126339 stop:127307 length:969 start_codon:yes stop_codon:yes gene_type:complete